MTVHNKENIETKDYQNDTINKGKNPYHHELMS